MIINLRRIRSNAAELAGICPLIAVIKADAYGMGATVIADALSDIACGFAVWTDDEAFRLCENGSIKDILVLGKAGGRLIRNNVIHTVFSANEAAGLTESRASVKINTGMNRMGADISELEIILDVLRRKEIAIDSVYTHLFCTYDKAITQKQIALFDEATDGLGVPRHVAASGALMYDFANKYDYIRCGLALYSDAVAVFAKIIKVRNLKTGDYVGYGDKTLKNDLTAAIINIGYGDGYRQLIGERYVFAGGKRCRVISVCMDVSIVDITDVPVREGDCVEVLGNKIMPQELGASYKTNAYEAYAFYGRVRKIYVQ